jgi:hypothetical protein
VDIFLESTTILNQGLWFCGEKLRKLNFPPKMGELKNKWYHQKVLLKSFPMNGHVGRS